MAPPPMRGGKGRGAQCRQRPAITKSLSSALPAPPDVRPEELAKLPVISSSDPGGASAGVSGNGAGARETRPADWVGGGPTLTLRQRLCIANDVGRGVP